MLTSCYSCCVSKTVNNRRVVPPALQQEYAMLTPYVTSRIRVVRLTKKRGTFGFAIRGGIEHGTGVFVSEVEEGSEAYHQKLRIGDQILRVNGFSIDQAIHSEVLALIRSKSNLVLKVKGVGMIPVKEQKNDPLTWKVVDHTSSASLRINHKKSLSSSSSRSSEFIETKLFLNMTGYSGLGCSICKGPKERPGIFVQSTKEGGLAREIGLRAGDQIIEVNGLNFLDIDFQEAVKFLKSHKHLDFVIRKGAGSDLFPGESSGYNSSSSSVNGESVTEEHRKRSSAVRDETNKERKPTPINDHEFHHQQQDSPSPKSISPSNQKNVHIVEVSIERSADELDEVKKASQEGDRLKEEQKIKQERRKQQEEERQLQEERRIAEERRITEERRLAEERRITEERRLAEERRITEERRQEEIRREEEKRLEEISKKEEERSLKEIKRREEERMYEDAKREELQRQENETKTTFSEDSDTTVSADIENHLEDNFSLSEEKFDEDSVIEEIRRAAEEELCRGEEEERQKQENQVTHLVICSEASDNSTEKSVIQVTSPTRSADIWRRTVIAEVHNNPLPLPPPMPKEDPELEYQRKLEEDRLKKVAEEQQQKKEKRSRGPLVGETQKKMNHDQLIEEFKQVHQMMFRMQNGTDRPTEEVPSPHWSAEEWEKNRQKRLQKEEELLQRVNEHAAQSKIKERLQRIERTHQESLELDQEFQKRSRRQMVPTSPLSNKCSPSYENGDCNIPICDSPDGQTSFKPSTDSHRPSYTPIVAPSPHIFITPPEMTLKDKPASPVPDYDNSPNPTLQRSSSPEDVPITDSRQKVPKPPAFFFPKDSKGGTRRGPLVTIGTYHSRPTPKKLGFLGQGMGMNSRPTHHVCSHPPNLPNQVTLIQNGIPSHATVIQTNGFTQHQDTHFMNRHYPTHALENKVTIKVLGADSTSDERHPKPLPGQKEPVSILKHSKKNSATTMKKNLSFEECPIIIEDKRDDVQVETFDPLKLFTERQIAGREVKMFCIPKANPLDIQIEGGFDSPLGGRIIVSDILEGGEIYKHGLITKGDQLMWMNGHSLIDVPLSQAQGILRETARIKEPLKVIIAKAPPGLYDDVTFF